MFMLTTVHDNIRVQPEELSAPAAVSIETEIRKQFFDKILPAVGLVVSLYDILTITGGLVHSGDGGAHYKVSFRLVIFRPFEGEILVGQIQDSSPCVLNWIDNRILIPVKTMPGCRRHLYSLCVCLSDIIFDIIK